MRKHIATIEQIALYLGKPWKFNRNCDHNHYRAEIIDGQGRGFGIRLDNSQKKFSISGLFPPKITNAHGNDYKTIGVSVSRPAKDIAADINRRLLPHYLETFETARARFLEQQQQEQYLDNVAQSLVKVTGGRVSNHSGRGQRTVYFTNGEAQVYGYSNEVKLTLNHVPCEQAIILAAMFCAPAAPVKYEVLTHTLCDGWVNTWLICEEGQPDRLQTFDSEAEAQAELDAFFQEIDAEVQRGEREADQAYDRSEYRISRVTE